MFVNAGAQVFLQLFRFVYAGLNNVELLLLAVLDQSSVNKNGIKPKRKLIHGRIALRKEVIQRSDSGIIWNFFVTSLAKKTIDSVDVFDRTINLGVASLDIGADVNQVF